MAQLKGGTTVAGNLVVHGGNVADYAQIFKLTQDDGLLKTITTATDLNTITDTGFYFIAFTGVTHNKPITNHGYFSVLKYSDSRVAQEFVSDNGGRIFKRNLYNTTWQGWVEVATSGSLIIPARTSDPTSPAIGEMWLRTDL